MSAVPSVRPDPDTLRASLESPPPPPDGADPDLDHVVEWLAGLTLLHGVPLSYLVPDAAMLPAESIRFFRIDQSWIDCLLDGAYSLGGAPVTAAAASSARADVLSRVRTRAAALRAEAVDASPPDDARGDHVTTGFLLRSAAVSGWPGMEIAGYADVDAQEHLPIVRLECLGPNVLLCMFGGDVERVEFREPTEGIHFGVDPVQGGGWQKGIRSLGPDATGERTASPPVSVPVRNASPSVVRVADLAAELSEGPSRPAGTEFTAAEFGLQMVEPVPAVGYRLRKGERSG